MKNPKANAFGFFWWSLLYESRTLNEITCGDEILTPFG